jgi:methionine biosynthesis protein MetW
MNGNGQGRWDHDIIYELVPEGSSVLDLGCGDGELLARLSKDKKVKGLGIEKEFAQIAAAISRRVPVLDVDLDAGLSGLPDGFYDYVILEKTLQVVNKPLFVLEEMLRVGRAGILSFPNFGHWRIVSQLIETGKMPVTPALPYQWYDTPNIHLFTARDFLDWAGANDVRLNAGYSLVDGKVFPFKEDDAVNAEEILMVISRRSS